MLFHMISYCIIFYHIFHFAEVGAKRMGAQPSYTFVGYRFVLVSGAASTACGPANRSTETLKPKNPIVRVEFFLVPLLFWCPFFWGVAGVGYNCATFASCGRKNVELLTGSGFCNPTRLLGL